MPDSERPADVFPAVQMDQCLYSRTTATYLSLHDCNREDAVEQS